MSSARVPRSISCSTLISVSQKTGNLPRPAIHSCRTFILTCSALSLHLWMMDWILLPFSSSRKEYPKVHEVSADLLGDVDLLESVEIKGHACTVEPPNRGHFGMWPLSSLQRLSNICLVSPQVWFKHLQFILCDLIIHYTWVIVKFMMILIITVTGMVYNGWGIESMFIEQSVHRELAACSSELFCPITRELSGYSMYKLDLGRWMAVGKL